MTKQRSNHKLSKGERISVAINLCICVIAIIIFCMLLAMRASIIAAASLINQNRDHVEAETETAAAIAIPTETYEYEVICADEWFEHEKTHITEPEPEETDVTEPEETLPVIENLQNSVSEWCLENENCEEISVWKMTDREGKLHIALKNSEDQFFVTFKYEDVESEYYDEWTLCDKFFANTTTRDIIDYAFMAYHEVSGRNAKNVQAQVMTAINRQKSDRFPNSIRKVITERKQYACSKSVINRWIKDGNKYLEREDLEKCFRQVLLVLAGELIQEVPSNVVYAATGRQGSGVWMVIDSTYYCYL